MSGVPRHLHDNSTWAQQVTSGTVHSRSLRILSVGVRRVAVQGEANEEGQSRRVGRERQDWPLLSFTLYSLYYLRPTNGDNSRFAGKVH